MCKVYTTAYARGNTFAALLGKGYFTSKFACGTLVLLTKASRLTDHPSPPSHSGESSMHISTLFRVVSWTLGVGTLLSLGGARTLAARPVSCLSAAFAMPPSGPPQARIAAGATIRSLTREVEGIRARFASARALPAATRSKLLTMLDAQLSDLGSAAKTYPPGTSTTNQAFASRLSRFFARGNALRGSLRALPRSSLRGEYSPDPQQCANHCEQTCGYNSVGEKVCWFRCYYCCGHGGC